MKQTQTHFWAVNMGKPPPYDPIRDTEYMARRSLADAEADGVLTHLVSTYDGANDRIQIGLRAGGPRILTFAPILDYEQVPLNTVLRDLMRLCEDKLQTRVEIEFAANLDPDRGAPARLGFLQVRPMVVSDEDVEVTEDELQSDRRLLASRHIMGNGQVTDIHDIVYVKPDTFTSLKTGTMAVQLEALNRELVEVKRPYLLIGYGRWGTSDPAQGVPVNFGQISGAKAIVETTLPGMYFNFSQGSHFFHNMTSFRILYFFVEQEGGYAVDWDWLGRQATVSETDHVRWVRPEAPIMIKVDGRSGQGVILR
jgi:hypothetical protein